MSDFSNFSLDDDCLLHIFSYLSYTALEASGLVCQEWLRIARANLLWKGASAHFYIPNDFDETFESDYRRLYKFKVKQDDYWLRSQYITLHPITHDHSVRGVAFSTVAPDILASCGYDSAVHVYKLNSFPAPIRSFKTLYSGIYSSSERLSRVKWTCNGEHLVVTSSTVGGIYYYDAEHSVGPLKFFKRVSSGRLDRTALATHPKFPYLLAAAGDDEEHREGGDVSLVDVRVPGGPVRIMRGLHRNTVRDIEWLSEDQILTASPDGTVKISTLEGRTHTTIQVTARAEAAVYDGALSATCVQVGETEERKRHVAVGCSGIVQLWDIKEASNPVLLEDFDTCNNYLPVWRLKYNKRGTLLFAASDDGFVAMYRRKKINGQYRHQFIGNVLSHSNDVSDLDISLNEDHVASASQSREVGLASLIPISTI